MGKSMSVAVALIFTILICGCATKWKNTNTGLVREGVPKYNECSREIHDTHTNATCYISCHNYYEKIYGKVSFSQSAACTDQCQEDRGPQKIYDNRCNEERAKQDGWVPLKE